MRLVPPLLLLSVCGSLAAGPAGAAVFAFTDAQGTVHYSNVPADSRYRLVIAAVQEAQHSPVAVSRWLQKSATYSNMIEGAARANGLEPALVTAVIAAESGGDPQAISKRGARGLMQLMPATALQYGVSNVFDPEQNIRAGSQYLRDLAIRYQDDVQLMLAAYNAGPSAVDQHGGKVPPLRETLEYVPRVLQIYRQLLDLAQAR